MRTRWIVLTLAAVLTGALGGAMLVPKPTGAVSKEIIQLQEQVAQLLQGQQDLRSAIDTNNATLRTLIQQSLDSVNRLGSQMDAMQKSVQESNANSSSRIDTMSTQTQGLADNIQDVQARVGKLGQQMNDIQSLLQSIDGKISGGGSAPANSANSPGTAPSSVPGPAAGGNPAVPSMPAISADTLYQNALRDFSTGKYDLSRQEFDDYIKNFPTNDLASNAQFYLGEISYAQGNYQDAIAQYEIVMSNYPKSYKLAASQLKKAFAELELGTKSAGIRDLRDVVRRFPGSDEARRAQAKLKEVGASPTSRPPTR